MTAAALLILAAAIVAAAWLVARRPSPAPGGALDELEARTVVLHTRDGKSLRGILTGIRPDGFRLEVVESLHSSGVQPIQGPVVVPRDNVAFFQRVGGDA